MIAACEDRKGCLGGLTVHGDELFIVRYISSCLIEVYSAKNFMFERNIEVGTDEDDGRSYWLCEGLTSCDSNNCLYVSCSCSEDSCIVRVELTGENKAVEWKVGGPYRPHKLSVNSEHNLMVACDGEWPHKLIEYTTRGELVREILLQHDVDYPKSAIQVKSQFFVCHGANAYSMLNRVCVVDVNGSVLLSYGNEVGSETGQLNGPHDIAVDRNGFIFVADYYNNRIVVLDSTLKWSRDLQIAVDGGLQDPHSLYLDEQRGLLFVGESNNDDSRVVIVSV